MAGSRRQWLRQSRTLLMLRRQPSPRGSGVPKDSCCSPGTHETRCARSDLSDDGIDDTFVLVRRAHLTNRDERLPLLRWTSQIRAATTILRRVDRAGRNEQAAHRPSGGLVGCLVLRCAESAAQILKSDGRSSVGRRHRQAAPRRDDAADNVVGHWQRSTHMCSAALSAQ
jgi:hypothetical protein